MSDCGGGGRTIPSGTSATGQRPDGKKAQIGLDRAAETFWPTPRANDAEKRGHIANDARSGLPAAGIHWPTPRSTDAEKGGPNQRGSKGDLTLPSATHLWSTPKTSDANGTQEPESRQGGPGLNTQASLWATPAARDWKDGRASPETLARNSRPLNEQAVSLWATPNAAGGTWCMSGSKRDTWRPSLVGQVEGYRPQKGSRPSRSGRPSATTPMDGRGSSPSIPASRPRLRLNPRFVAWLMGFPPDWFRAAHNCAPSVMRGFLSWGQRHSALLEAIFRDGA